MNPSPAATVIGSRNWSLAGVQGTASPAAGGRSPTLLLLLLLCIALTLTGCAAREREVTPEHAFRYAENQAGDFPTTLAAYYFAEQVAERSNGRIRIFVYPDAVLGDERSVIEQMQHGGIDFGRVNLSPLSEYDPSLFALQLPYLYEDSDHMWRVLDSEIGEKYLASLANIDVVGLAWVDAGARHFYTVDGPVRSLADMRGLRIRVQENTLMERMVELLGAEAVQMRYGDVLAALQTGKIDGAENNYPSYYSTGHYLVALHVMEDGHSRIPEVILASNAAMAKLSDEDRALVIQAAQDAALYQRALWREYEAETRAQAIENGCVIIRPTGSELAGFQEMTAQMTDEFAQDAMETIDKINAMRTGGTVH